MSDAVFYCYALFRENGTPFYIGKGKGDRWLSHEYRAVRGGTHKDNIICSMRDRGVSVPKCKLIEGLSAAEALQVEIDLIALVGRIPNGPLVNKTAGGDGVSDPLPETRAKLRAAHRGRELSRDHRAKIAAGGIGRITSDATRAKQSATAAGKPKSAAHCRRMSLARKGCPNKTGYRHTEEAKEKMRAAAQGRKASAETRLKMSVARKGRPSWNKGRSMPPEAVAKTAAANRGRKLSAEHRAAITAANNRRWSKYRADQIGGVL